MNSDKTDDKKLPDGWVLCESKSIPGRPYYFNRRTGKSSWTEPKAEQCANKQKPRRHRNSQDKGRKEGPQKKNLKRRSDGDVHVASKKHKQGGPERHSTGTVNTPRKQLESHKHDSPNKSKKKETSHNTPHTTSTPVMSKNLANKRLLKLRGQLEIDAQKEESAKKSQAKEENESPSKVNKHKFCPNSSQAEMPSKVTKLELKSPNLNDSKCSTTTQSPSSDSIQSIPSPSQFLAANKIISSMKAQLSEEYKDKNKPKDTFADIVEGINNQVTEYPFLKHPATPPQFSEANKLVSAIKSKLTSNNVKTFTSARDRMESLRNSLTEQTNDDLNTSSKEVSAEAMEVDNYKEIKPSTYTIYSTPIVQTKDIVADMNDNLVLVVDTNIFIHELEVITHVLNSHIRGSSEQPTLLVPWRVINELDRLKDSNNGNAAICKRAKSAMDYLYKSLPENDRIKGQSLRDANSHIYPCELPDDEILNCCLQQCERGKSVILLSNDKNLCNKATINQVKCLSLNDLKSLLENKPPPCQDHDHSSKVKHCQAAMHQLLANILENELRAKYNDLWRHVICKEPPWSLLDVLQCLLKHWIAVFNEVFPRIEHLITELRNIVRCMDEKDPKTVTQSEASYFKELCLDVARKCQIIPEYMVLAKATVERLVRDHDAAPVACPGDKQTVIDTFEGVWTVFSSYCAKLSTKLNISHNLEDHMPSEDTVEMLVERWPEFNAQVIELSEAINGVISIDKSEQSVDHVVYLERAFRNSLELLNMNSSVISTDNIRAFCNDCRSMLQEAYSKFSQLTTLLEACKQQIVRK